MTHKSKSIAVIVGIFFLVTLSYITFLNKPLTSDDYYFFSPSVVQNPWISFVRDMVPDDPDAVFLRPLPILTFALESHFKGMSPVLSNSINLFFHLVTTALVGLLISLPYKQKSAVRDAFAPVAGMLIFALHPQATGAVCWVSARFDLMCGFFGVMGVYAWLKTISKSDGFRWRFAAILCFALSILSKETGIIFPPAIFLWELWRWITNRGSINAKRQAAALSSLLILVVVYLIYRFSVLGGMGGYSHFGFDVLGWSGSAGYVLVMFWPFEKMGPMPSIMFSITLVFLAVAIILVANWKKQNTNNPDKNLWLLPVLLCVFPSILLLPNLRFLTARQVLEHAEARLSYIPLIGFSVLMGWLLKKGRDFRIGRIIVPAFLSLLMCFYVWAQQGEISRWTKAGKTAESILNQIVTLVPNPPKGATFLFGNPQLMATDRYYYVFGMGLAEALTERYQREDLNILQRPNENVLKNPPENSYIFRFDWENYKIHKNIKIELINSPSK